MSLPKRLVIVGARETAQRAYEYFTDDTDYEVAGFALEPEYLTSSFFLDLPLVSTDRICEAFPSSEFDAFVAVGSGRINKARERLCCDMRDKGYHLASYIAPSTYVGRGVEFGDNVFIMENCTLQRNVRIGSGVTMFSGCQIEHLSSIGDYAWLASGVVVSGSCAIGSRCFLGSNSTLMNNVKIADANVIGAGCVVARSIKRSRKIFATDSRMISLGDSWYERFAGGN